MAIIQRTGVLSQFTCLGDACDDTCCVNWSMQLDDPTFALYRKEAPELLNAVEELPDHTRIMRKNPKNFACVKLEDGLCGIHKSHGAKFLGDACFFYPRVTRALGERIIMTAAMSCPEITRLALSQSDPCRLEEVESERLPHTVKDYLPESMTPDEAIAIHQAFLDATNDESASAEQVCLRLSSASRSLERLELKSWHAMAAFYLNNADMRIPKIETDPADPFHLLHALCGLIVASHKPLPPRLQDTIEDMERALDAKIDWQTVQLETGDDSVNAYLRLHALWQQEAAAFYAPVLRRWLHMQMSLALYPFAGLGATLSERITCIGVKLATIKLALLCSHSIHGGVLPQEKIVRNVQSISRFLDHLGDPVFSLRIYTETGWVKESRLCGLLRL